MPPTTTRNCVFTFNTSLDGTRTIRIPDQRTGILVPEFGAVAQGFIGVNPFDESVGSLTSLRRAEIITETRTVLI